jgi:PST family polysaccharide transporter
MLAEKGEVATVLVPAASSRAGEDQFATDHLLVGLKRRTVSSGVVTGLAQLVQLVLSLGAMVVLARLLTPRDFGLVAMVTTITGFLRIFNEGGLSTATIQKDGITHAEVSNLFWANVALGTVATVLLALSAPAVAWFYREPQLVAVTAALSVTFLLTGSTVQHLALLKRQMRFSAIAAIQLASIVTGVSVGIAMAWLGYGYWCLVGMQLSSPVVSCVLTWSVSRWRPRLPSRHSGTRALLGFGANLTASSLLWSLARGSDALLIGRFHGSAALGLYSRGGALLLRPLEQAMAPLDAVFVPTLSRLQNHPERYRRIVLQVLDGIALACFLFAGLLLPLAQPLTVVILGPQWVDAAPIFAAFTVVAVYVPFAGVAGWIIASQGRGTDFLVLSTVASAVIVASFVASVPFGLVAVAVSYSLCSLLVNLPVAFYMAGKGGLVSSLDLWQRLFAHVPLWIVVFGTTYTTHRQVAHLGPLEQVAICGSVGLLAGLAFCAVYPPSRDAAASLIAVVREWANHKSVHPLIRST